MTLHDRLSRMVEHSLPGTLIPISSLAELLQHHQTEPRTTADPGLSLEEVAQRCAARGVGRKPVAPATVRKWIREGLAGVKLVAFRWGTSYRVAEAELESFIEGVKRAKRADASGPLVDVPPAGPDYVEDEIEAARVRFSRGRGGRP